MCMCSLPGRGNEVCKISEVFVGSCAFKGVKGDQSGRSVRMTGGDWCMEGSGEVSRARGRWPRVHCLYLS